MSLWGTNESIWLEYVAINSSGRVLCMWKKECFEVVESFIGQGYVGLKGAWKESQTPCLMFNNYAPCALAEKISFWSEMLQLKN